MSHEAHTYDDMKVGLVFTSGPRVVTREDIDTFARLSGDYMSIHTNDDYAATTPFGGVIAHGALNIAIATGLAYETGILDGTILAFRSLTMAFNRPVFPGDSLTFEAEVTQMDPSPREESGKVTTLVTLRNQNGKKVISGDWVIVLKR